jgi:hypothetical protein
MAEIWKDIKGYENLYQISTFGRVKSFPRKGTVKYIKILKQAKDSSGYSQVCLTKNKTKISKAIHKLVALHFIKGKKDKIQINHKDGNKENNNVINLEWVSQLENKKHAVINNLVSYGEKHHSAKLKQIDVLKIRRIKDFKNQELKKLTAKKYAVSIFTINDILKKRTWLHV